MGIGSASRAQQQATQQAMLIQAIANQQAADRARAAETQQRSDLGASQAAAEQALLEGRQRGAQALIENRDLGATALRRGEEQSAQALRDYYTRGIGFQQPYLQAGEGATNRLAALYGQGGEYTQQPGLEQLQMDPGYAFRLQQGQQALQSTLGASGLRGSGAALKAGTRYGQEAGSQEYQNAYNRFMANRAAVTQGLQGLSAGGLSAAGTATNLAGQTGANLGNVFGTTGTNLANLYNTAGGNLSNVYTGTGGQLANANLSTGQQLASNAMTTGNTLAGLQSGLGQSLGQGYANIGNIQAQQAMAPINMLASGLGQAAQLGAMAYGGGFGLNPAARASSYGSSGGMRFPVANAGGGFSPTGWG